MQSLYLMQSTTGHQAHICINSLSVVKSQENIFVNAKKISVFFPSIFAGNFLPSQTFCWVSTFCISAKKA